MILRSPAPINQDEYDLLMSKGRRTATAAALLASIASLGAYGCGGVPPRIDRPFSMTCAQIDRHRHIGDPATIRDRLADALVHHVLVRPGDDNHTAAQRFRHDIDLSCAMYPKQTPGQPAVNLYNGLPPEKTTFGIGSSDADPELGGRGATRAALASFHLAGRTCSQIITSSEISARAGRLSSEIMHVVRSVHQKADNASSGYRDLGWLCNFRTTDPPIDGFGLPDLNIRIVMAPSVQHVELYGPLLRGPGLAPIAGLGSMAAVYRNPSDPPTREFHPTTVYVLAKNALVPAEDVLLEVSGLGLVVKPHQLEDIARKIYARLTG